MGGFNGSGTYVRYYNWQQDAANGINITASRVDTEDDGYATGLSTCITKNGQTTITANLPMAGFRHTGVGTATVRDQYAQVGQIQDGSYIVLGTVSGTNVIAASTTPVISAYAPGQVFRFIATGTTTGATTLNILALGAKPITKSQSPLVAGDITSGDAVEVYYDGTSFQLLSAARTPSIPASGLLQAAINTTQTSIASAATTDLGTITSQNALITGTTTITSFGSSAAIGSPLYFVEFGGALILTYNATSLIIPGSANITTAAGDTGVAEYLGSGNWRIRTYMKADGTAVIAPAVAYASTATTQAGTVTNQSVTPGGLKGALDFSTFYESPQQTVTLGTTTTLSHGLSSIPKIANLELVCVTGELGYVTGDIVSLNYAYIDGSPGAGRSRGYTITYNSSNVYITTGSFEVDVLARTTGVVTAITLANWKFVARCWA